MLALLLRLSTVLRRGARRVPKHYEIAAMLVALYAASVVVFRLAGEGDLSDPFNVLWWTVVTFTTVGYGDISPTTALGETWAIFVLVVGVGLMAVLLGEVASSVVSSRARSMNGLKSYRALSDHTVVLGYELGTTEDILSEIHANIDWAGEEIVLVDERLQQNPYPERCHFVRAPLTSDDAVERSGLDAADHVVVFGRTDHETALTALLAARVATRAHVVAYVREASSKHAVTRVNSRISVVAPISACAVVQELQNPGVVDLVADLMDNKGQSVYRVRVPEMLDTAPHAAVTVGALRQHYALKGATLIGADADGQRVLNPADGFHLTLDDHVFVIAEIHPCPPIS